MTFFKFTPFALPGLLLAVAAAGCASPYHSDQGALFGGLLGAGTGAVVGHALGSTGAGAAIGAGVGALSGAAIGNGMDETEARNRAMIEQRLGRQIAAGAVSVQDVVAMVHAGVDEEIIVNHIHTHGVGTALQAADLIYLQQQRVSPRIIETMQATPLAAVQPVAVYPAGPQPVIVDEYWGRPYHGYYYRHYPPPSVGWGMSFSGR
jgi:hypothetical protein